MICGSSHGGGYVGIFMCSDVSFPVFAIWRGSVNVTAFFQSVYTFCFLNTLAAAVIYKSHGETATYIKMSIICVLYEEGGKYVQQIMYGDDE